MLKLVCVRVLKQIGQGVQVGSISRFGLLEMSRQRLRPSLSDTHQEVCPRCSGLGRVRDAQSLGLAMLRLIEEEATKASAAKLVVQLPVSVATFLLNEKRVQLDEIEQQHTTKLIITPNPYIDAPEYNIERIKTSNDRHIVSHHVVAPPDLQAPTIQSSKAREQAAVTGISPAQPAPVLGKKSQSSFWQRFMAIFLRQTNSDQLTSATGRQKPNQVRRHNHRHNNPRFRSDQSEKGSVTARSAGEKQKYARSKHSSQNRHQHVRPKRNNRSNGDNKRVATGSK